jgi:hypothetical protein
MCGKTTGKRSQHHLPKWLSNRPECGLEKFHEHLAHLANTGLGKELADVLALSRMTKGHNVRASCRNLISDRKDASERDMTLWCVSGSTQIGILKAFSSFLLLPFLSSSSSALPLPIFDWGGRNLQQVKCLVWSIEGASEQTLAERMSLPPTFATDIIVGEKLQMMRLDANPSCCSSGLQAELC